MQHQVNFEDSFYIGYISKTKGLKGEVQLFFEFEEYEALELDVLFLEIDRKLVPFFVERLKIYPNRTAYLFLEDVGDIDTAKALVRKKVYLPVNLQPVRSAEDFRMTDLKGFWVHDLKNGELGQIVDVQAFPQQHIATVIYRGNELMFPLTDDLIIKMDRENNRLQINLPDGLIDVYIST